MAHPFIQVRSSRLGWPDCPRRGSAYLLWREIKDAGYDLRWIERTHIATAVGSAAHAGDAHFLRELAATGEAGGPARVAAAVEVGIETFKRLTPLDCDLITDGITKDRRDGERVVARLIETYNLSIDPADEPVLIEERLAIQIGSVVLSSTPDRFLVSGRLPDLKTGQYNPLSAAAQLGGQSIVVRTHHPQTPITWVGVEWQPRRKPEHVRPPQRIAFDQAAAEHQAWSAIMQMEREVTAWRASVEAGNPDPNVFPTRPESYLCSADYCPAFGTRWCHAWRLKANLQKKAA